MLTEITRNSILQKTVHRWRDEVGLCIPAKSSWATAPLLEHFDNSRIAEKGPQSAKLIVDQRIHGIDTVDVTNVDLTTLGHGYEADAWAVLNDMHATLAGVPAKRRFAIAPKMDRGVAYWALSAVASS